MCRRLFNAQPWSTQTHTDTQKRTNTHARAHARTQRAGCVLWSSEQFRALWCRSGFWEGCACLTVISWTGILWHHTHEKQTPSPSHTDPGHFHSLAAQQAKGAQRNSLGSKTSYSIARVIRSEQQLYATRPPGGWEVGRGGGGIEWRCPSGGVVCVCFVYVVFLKSTALVNGGIPA